MWVGELLEDEFLDDHLLAELLDLFLFLVSRATFSQLLTLSSKVKNFHKFLQTSFPHYYLYSAQSYSSFYQLPFEEHHQAATFALSQWCNLIECDRSSSFISPDYLMIPFVSNFHPIVTSCTFSVFSCFSLLLLNIRIVIIQFIILSMLLQQKIPSFIMSVHTKQTQITFAYTYSITCLIIIGQLWLDQSLSCLLAGFPCYEPDHLSTSVFPYYWLSDFYP